MSQEPICGCCFGYHETEDCDQPASRMRDDLAAVRAELAVVRTDLERVRKERDAAMGVADKWSAQCEVAVGLASKLEEKLADVTKERDALKYQLDFHAVPTGSLREGMAMENEEKLAAAQVEIGELRRVLRMVSPDVRTSDWDCQIIDALEAPTVARPLLEAIAKAHEAMKDAVNLIDYDGEQNQIKEAIAALAPWCQE